MTTATATVVTVTVVTAVVAVMTTATATVVTEHLPRRTIQIGWSDQRNRKGVELLFLGLPNGILVLGSRVTNFWMLIYDH